MCIILFFWRRLLIYWLVCWEADPADLRLTSGALRLATGRWPHGDESAMVGPFLYTPVRHSFIIMITMIIIIVASSLSVSLFLSPSPTWKPVWMMAHVSRDHCFSVRREMAALRQQRRRLWRVRICGVSHVIFVSRFGMAPDTQLVCSSLDVSVEGATTLEPLLKLTAFDWLNCVSSFSAPFELCSGGNYR